MNHTHHIDWIDKAKGLAILGVVACHSIWPFHLPNVIADIAYAGRYGVSLFFIISAYLTFQSLDRNNESALTAKTYFKFLFHKILRLVPVLYIAILWQFAQYSISIGKIPDISDTIWQHVLYAATFTNGFSFRHFNPWFNWYIGTLVIFLALSPIIHKYINTSLRSVFLFLVTLILSWVIKNILNHYGIDTNDFFYYGWFPAQLPVMSLGIVFYYLLKTVPSQSNHKAIKKLGIIISICLLLSLCAGMQVMQFHITIGILLLILSYSAFNNQRRIFNWLIPLGRNCYGIYLFHGCFVYMNIIPAVSTRFGIDTSSLIFFFIYYILLVFLSMICSQLANKYIEKPFFKFTNRKLGI